MHAGLRAIASGRRTWLVTGGAGFIGSHLVETLLSLGQKVRVLDSFVTGHRRNLVEHLLRLGQSVRCLDDFSTGHRANLAEASAGAPERFTLVEGDIRDPAACAEACRGVDYLLHQAALGSVPRSIERPLATHDVNVTGFLQVLEAARAARVRRVVYASSSSVYGDHPGLPKVEEAVGRPLSPYAVSKRADELYAAAFASAYGMELVGLRYFNVFGPRQDPRGPYAAVIPLWFESLFGGRPPVVFGDGETSRDFCFVENVVQANLLAATTPEREALGQAFNVAYGEQTTLVRLFELMRELAAARRPAAAAVALDHRPFRAGDIRHSLADTSRARRLLGYAPTASVQQGLARSVDWYAARQRAPGG